MKTGSWLTYRGPGRFGISLGSPRRQPAGYRLFKALAPTRPMLSMARDENEAFERVFAKVVPPKTGGPTHGKPEAKKGDKP